MLEVPSCGEQGQKQLFARTAPKRHPCLIESNSRRKKLLSQVGSPAANLNGRVDAVNLLPRRSTLKKTSEQHDAPSLQQVQDPGSLANASIYITPSKSYMLASQGNDEVPIQAALENMLNSSTYCKGPPEALSPLSGNYSKEFVEHLLTLLPIQDRARLMRSHELQSSRNLLPRFEAYGEEHAIEVNLPSCRGNDNRPSLPSPEPTVPSLLGTTEGVMIGKEQFDEKLRELARDERKYRKKQRKKQAKELKEKMKVNSMAIAEEEVLRSPLTPRALQPLVPNLINLPSSVSGRRYSSPSGGSSHPQMQKKKDLSLSNGASGKVPVSLVGTSLIGDSDLSSWGVLNKVPVFEVNSLAAPVGQFWDHMRHYAFQQAASEFPWHKDWNKQCPQLKARFVLHLHKIYHGPWDHTDVLKAVGANLRARRTRLKRNFDKVKNPKQVSKPGGCTYESWMQIYESTKDTKKRRKSELCKEATKQRLMVQGFTHRCGPGGMKSLHDRFVDYCKRPPTDEELEFGKYNGWFSLKEKMTTLEKGLDPLHDQEISQVARINCETFPNDAEGQNLLNGSDTSDTSSGSSTSSFTSASY